jgi:hypothetical protein
MERNARHGAAQPRLLGARLAARTARLTQAGGVGPDGPGSGIGGALIGRFGTGVLLPVVGVLVAPLVVTGYVGLTMLSLPVLGLRSLLRPRAL